MGILQAEHLDYGIGNRIILHDVNTRCDGGTMTALYGPSGCGKTTLLDLLGMLVVPKSGVIAINGESTGHWNDGRRCRFWHEHAAFVFQDYGMVPGEDVAYNILLDRREARRNRRHASERLAAILGHLRLDGMLTERVESLSGGERQRVGIARALWKDADFVFADEPTASLDSGNRRLVTGLLSDMASRGACVVIATHDEELIAQCHQTIDVGRFAG